MVTTALFIIAPKMKRTNFLQQVNINGGTPIQ